MPHHQHQPHESQQQKQAKLAFGQIEPTAIKLEEAKAKQVVGLLCIDLANANVLYHQLKKHHWVVQGPEFYGLHKMFEEQVKALDKQIDEVGERIVVLGGVPVGSPGKIQELAHIQSEPEGIFELRQMLENDLRCYQVCISRLREHCDLCRQCGDYGSAHLLEEALLIEERFCHDLETIMAKDSLVQTIGNAVSR